MGGRSDWRSDFQPGIPTPARIYDYLLGGKDNYPADREAAREVLAAVPDARTAAAANRAFLRRAVRYLAGEAGLRQFIDIGSGLPTQGNVHEIAQRAAPEARVVYIDNDPMVLAHSRAMLHGVTSTIVIEHDLRRPRGILADRELGKLIDFAEPAGLLLVGVLPFVSDSDDPAGIIARLLEPLAPGSHVALSHGTADGRPESAKAERVYDRATARVHTRGRDQVQAMVAGLELVEPGLVWAPLWRPGPGPGAGPGTEPGDDPGRSHAYVVVARKPGA